jgi:hypothetical protein
MSFANTVLQDNPDLGAGEVITASPYNVSSFETFENGLIEGRFAKFDSGRVDNMDGSGTPVVVGIVKRKITGEIGTGVYSTTGTAIDSVAEIINFGFATVTVTGTADPSRYDPVQYINAANADAGKATEAAVTGGIVSAGDVVFWEQKSALVWLVRINKFI